MSNLDLLWEKHSENSKDIQKNIYDILLTDQFLLNSDFSGYLNLFQHLIIEHTFEYDIANELINNLKKTVTNESPHYKLILRFEVILELISTDLKSRERYLKLETSDQLRVLSSCIGSLASSNKFQLVLNILNEAKVISEKLTESDPAHRSFAINTNNLACALEEKEFLNSEEQQILQLSASTALKEWTLAGGWLEKERAYYRLASSYIKLNKPIDAVLNANKCLTICLDNSASAFELFFAYELLSRIEKISGQEARSKSKMTDYFAQLSEDEKKIAEPYMNALK